MCTALLQSAKLICPNLVARLAIGGHQGVMKEDVPPLVAMQHAGGLAGLGKGVQPARRTALSARATPSLPLCLLLVLPSADASLNRSLPSPAPAELHSTVDARFQAMHSAVTLGFTQMQAMLTTVMQQQQLQLQQQNGGLAGSAAAGGALPITPAAARRHAAGGTAAVSSLPGNNTPGQELTSETRGLTVSG